MNTKDKIQFTHSDIVGTGKSELKSFMKVFSDVFDL